MHTQSTYDTISYVTLLTSIPRCVLYHIIHKHSIHTYLQHYKSCYFTSRRCVLYNTTDKHTIHTHTIHTHTIHMYPQCYQLRYLTYLNPTVHKVQHVLLPRQKIRSCNKPPPSPPLLQYFPHLSPFFLNRQFHPSAVKDKLSDIQLCVTCSSKHILPIRLYLSINHLRYLLYIVRRLAFGCLLSFMMGCLYSLTYM